MFWYGDIVNPIELSLLVCAEEDVKFNVKKQKGVSLVEVVFAIAIAAFVTLAMIAAMSQSSVFSRNIDSHYTASYIAQRRIDMVKRLEFSQLGYAEEPFILVGVDGTMDEAGEYARKTELEIPYGGNIDLVKVKVTVQRLRILPDGSIADPYAENAFVSKPVVMETLLANVE